MRALSSILALFSVVSVSHLASAATVTVVSGGAALASFSQTSADGCIVIHGELAVVEATRGGELASGLYVTATREDSCTPDNGNGYAGFAEGRFDVVGLLFGRFAGTVVVDSYSGGPPLTVELDLWWLGKGAITPTHEVYRDGDGINFSFSASRNAITRGSFTVDGAPATVESATLAAQASGTVSR
jgi:hypothetical protein